MRTGEVLGLFVLLCSAVPTQSSSCLSRGICSQAQLMEISSKPFYIQLPVDLLEVHPHVFLLQLVVHGVRGVKFFVW